MAVTTCAVARLPNGVEPGDELTASILEHCRASIASFKCPRRVEYRSALPRSEAGKLLRRQLREEYWAGVGRRL